MISSLVDVIERRKIMNTMVFEEYPLEDLTEIEKFYPLIEFQREERVYLMKVLQEALDKLDLSKKIKSYPRYIESQDKVRDFNTEKLDVLNKINQAHDSKDIILMDDLVDKLISINYHINQEIEKRIEFVQSLGEKPS